MPLQIESEYDPDAIAFQDEAGRWRAGPDNAKDQNTGTFIDTTYAKRARSVRKYYNDLRRATRSDAKPETLAEARELVNEFRRKEKQLQTGQIDQEEFKQWLSETFES